MNHKIELVLTAHPTQAEISVPGLASGPKSCHLYLESTQIMGNDFGRCGGLGSADSGSPLEAFGRAQTPSL